MSREWTRRRRGRNSIDVWQDADARSQTGNALAINQTDATIVRVNDRGRRRGN